MCSFGNSNASDIGKGVVRKSDILAVVLWKLPLIRGSLLVYILRNQQRVRGFPNDFRGGGGWFVC